MEKFKEISGIVAPFNYTNVNTDTIIPKQYLKSIKRTGFGANLFDEWRYLDHGEPGQDCSQRPINPDFILNQSRYQSATILLTRANFGCGSSREHAPWALLDYGFRVIIAPSFADIFYNNCFKNGILPIMLEESVVQTLFEEIETTVKYELTVNLKTQCITKPGNEVIAFDMDLFQKHRLLNGLDDINITLQYVDEIKAYEIRRREDVPWLFQNHNSLKY